jgi:hypothetical protein
VYASVFPPIGTIQFSRTNYAAAWGNTNFQQSVSNLTANRLGLDLTFNKSVFGHSAVKMSDVSDGLSKTVALAEVIQGNTFDLRGFGWTPLPGGGMFMTRYTPNGTTDSFIGTGGATGPGDGMPNAPIFGFCTNEPPALPCYACGSDTRSFAGARSRHPGGVLMCRGDGSVSFASDSIDHRVWVSMSTVNGNETVSSGDGQ